MGKAAKTARLSQHSVHGPPVVAWRHFLHHARRRKIVREGARICALHQSAHAPRHCDQQHGRQEQPGPLAFRKVLDTLSVAVCVVSTGGKLAFVNSKAEALLAAGTLLRKMNGKLATARIDITGTALDDAIARGIKGDTALGISGIGVPLVSLDGERAAAYVLPIRGDDIRSQMGDGHAVVFIAQRGEQQPMAVEILRTLFDLTPMEAKVAYATSLGGNPELIATAHGIAIDTVTHTSSGLVKTDVTDKTALAARVNALIPPINAN